MKQFNQGMLALATCFSAAVSADLAEFYTSSEALVPQEVIVTPESITLDDIQRVQSTETYTYVRCWYRTNHHNHNDPATDWKWALKENGDYFTLDGYWYSSVSFKNMFYTDTSQDVIKQRH